MTRVAVAGAAGKMGRAVIAAIASTPSLRLSAAIDHQNAGQDAGTLAGMVALGTIVGSDIDAALSNADVLIDFSAPASTRALLPIAVAKKVALVIGTTGLSPADEKVLQQAAAEIPIVYSANLSLGVNLLARLVADAARALGPGYDIEIVELHHRQKKDAPSGTALLLGKAAAQAHGKALANVIRTGRDGQVGPRSSDEIGVLAVRGGDIVGEHTVYFCGVGERIELVHRASSRDTFAQGAVRAAEWVVAKGRAPGLYDMQDVLGLNT